MGKGRERFKKVPQKKAVWWDINSCPIPPGYDPRCVRPSIESALNKSCFLSFEVDQDVSIFAFGNLMNITPGDRKALSSSGIFMRHSEFSIYNPPPATFMLISEDPFTDLDLHDYLVNGISGRYYVIPAYPRSSSSEEWRWKTILEESPLLKTPTSQMLEHKCAGQHLWFCIQCQFGADTYYDFKEHLYGLDHYNLLYRFTHFPPNEIDIFFKFRKHLEEEFLLEEQESLSSEFPEKEDAQSEENRKQRLKTEKIKEKKKLK